MSVSRAAALLSSVLLLAGCEGMPGGPVSAPADEGPATIGALQGRGPQSPYLAREVSVQAVVTGNFVAGLDGFFMQDPAGADDGDPATSDGVFVQWTRERTPKVRRGDRVRVVGPVVELGQGERSVTAIAATRIEVLGRGGVHATTITEPPADEAGWERHEGMWLRIGTALTVSGNGGLARFGELEVAFGGRLFHATERHPPGPQAAAMIEDNRRRLLVLDDNRRTEFPDRFWYIPDGISPTAPLRAGSSLGGVEGILSHGFGRWRLHLTREIEVVEQAPRPAAPSRPPGITLASINLLNLFNGDGKGRGFPTLRGAETKQELERQIAKSVALVTGLQPDIWAAAELENDGHDARSAEATFLAALNKALGEAGDYRGVVVPTGGSGDDAIRVGLIYRASRVEPLGAPASLLDGPFRVGASRPPLAQAFRPVDGGPSFVVVANHFKSKGSCPAPEAEVDAADRDRGDGQSCWAATRAASARALHDWLQRDPTASGSQYAVLLGDLNAYAQEDAPRLLRERGWRDAFEVAGVRDPYSYVFAGHAGRLDHALVSPALARFVSGAVVWHVNADESEAFDYRIPRRRPEWYTPEAWRSSDHDPLLIGLDFSRP